MAESNEGHREASIGVQHAQIGDHLIRGTDANFNWEHQSDEDHPEKQSAKREAEVNQRKSRQQGDGNLANGDDQSADQTGLHHGPDGWHLATQRGFAAKQGETIRLPKIVARHHRHRDASGNLLSRLGRGHKREVQRKSHNRDTDQQDHVRQNVKARSSFDHVSTALSFQRSGTAPR
ncbi:MAG: hypothetical protein RL462_889 [Pseudomonadota bacterium]